MISKPAAGACVILFVCGFAAAAPDILVTVNGKPITKTDVSNRIWSVYGDAALNEMVDEALIEEAFSAWEAKAPKKEKNALKAEIAQRVKAVSKQAGAQNARLSEDAGKRLHRQITAQVRREALVIIATDLRITPDELRNYFDSNREALGIPESASLRHILLAEERQARDLLIAIKNGADFTKLARQLSLDAASKNRAGNLGFVFRGRILPEVEQAVFPLKPGQVSDVIKTPLGFHIFRVDRKRPAKPAVFETAKITIGRMLLARKVTAAWPGYIAELRKSARISAAPGTALAPALPAAAP